MSDLIERLEKADKPTRALFEAAYIACFGPVDWGIEGNSFPFRRFLNLIEVEAWTEAAFALIPIDHWGELQWAGEPGQTEHKWPLVEIGRGGHGHPTQARTIPLALAIAALRARAAFTSGDHPAGQRGGDG